MFYIGIDIAKDTLAVACIDLQGEVHFQFAAANNRGGFNKIRRHILKVAGKDGYTAGFESTGIYHMAWLKYCLEKNIPARIINPIITAQATRLSIRPRKTDKIDALLIARLTMGGHGRSVADYDLLDGRRAILNVIRMYQQCLQRIGGTKRTLQAEDAEALRAGHASMEATVKSLTLEINKLKKMLKSYADKDTRLLVSFKGIDFLSAHRIMDSIRTIDRFSSAEKLVAFCGLEPKPVFSGSSIHHYGRITKRGPGQVRHTLYLCAHIARIHDPEFRAFFEGLRARGLHYTAAICAVARKLLLRIYAVLKRGTPYVVRPVDLPI